MEASVLSSMFIKPIDPPNGLGVSSVAVEQTGRVSKNY
jgi:hypothetical protein